MTSLNLTPVQTVVTPEEVARSGQSNAKTLSKSEKSKIAQQLAVKRGPSDSGASTSSTNAQNTRQSQASTQIDATEQANAVSLSATPNLQGGKGEASRYKRIYQRLVSEDEKFYERDLLQFVKSLQDKARSEIDLNPQLSAEQKLLRKYLLAELGVGSELVNDDKFFLERFKSSLSADELSIIESAIAAFEASDSEVLSRASLRELVQSFSVISEKEASLLDDFLGCYKYYAHLIDRNDFLRQMEATRDVLVRIINRDRRNRRRSRNKIRDEKLGSRMAALSVLIKSYLIHQKFLKMCEGMGMKALPKTSALMDVTYQLVVGADLMGCFNGLVRQVMQIRADGSPAKNIFITNYSRLILQCQLYGHYYGNPQQVRQINDLIIRYTSAGAVLSASHYSALGDAFNNQGAVENKRPRLIR